MTEHGTPEDGAGATLRAAAVIVLAGALLGAGYNALARASRPPRGLAWVASQRALPSLEALQEGGAPADSGAWVGTRAAAGNGVKTADGQAGSAPGPAARPASGSAASGQPAASKPGTVPAGTARATPPAGNSAATPPAPSPVNPPAGAPPAAAAADLPAVPVRSEPIEVELATVKKFHDAGAAIFVDAREAPEFAEGHIPGARSVPFDDAVAKPALLQPFRNAGKPIVIYCGGGDCELSKSLAWNMISDGIRQVLVFTGGFTEWRAAGYPAERGASR